MRNALVAGAATLVALIIQGVWFGIVRGWTFLDLDTQLVIGCLGFVPLPLSCLWISRWYAGHWILERQSRAVRGRLCAWLLTPWLIATCGIMAFRVLEIPGIGIEPPTRQQLLTLNAEERHTAEMYRSVATAVGQRASDSEIADRLRQSKDLIDKLMEASRRSVGALAGDPSEQRRMAELLFRFISIADGVAHETKDFDTSLELCSTSMCVMQHWRQTADCTGNMDSRDVERQVLSLLRHRLATVTLKPDQYREVARRVASGDGPFQSFPRNCGWSYREALDSLRDGSQLVHTSKWEVQRALETSWTLWIPGELARARRLLRLEYAIAKADPWRGEIREVGGQPINSLMIQTRVLRSKTPIVPALIGDVSVHGEWPTRIFGLQLVPISARKRMLQMWLELQAEKIERGEWPATWKSLQKQDSYGDWIEYRPQGILGIKAPQPIVVRGLVKDQTRPSRRRALPGLFPDCKKSNAITGRTDHGRRGE